MFAEETLTRLEQRVTELCGRFDFYVDAFADHPVFTGPSVYFHRRALARRRELASAAAAGRDREFHELVYATLVAWGMHRMGNGNTKLVEFDDFGRSLAAAGEALARIDTARLGALDDAEAEVLAMRLWEVIAATTVGTGDTKLVAGTKALHHLAPELIPPVDRQYTLKFFFNHKVLDKSEGARFLLMFRIFNRIARECRGQIERRLTACAHLSTAKLLDNAVVGYVRRLA